VWGSCIETQDELLESRGAAIAAIEEYRHQFSELKKEIEWFVDLWRAPDLQGLKIEAAVHVIEAKAATILEGFHPLYGWEKKDRGYSVIAKAKHEAGCGAARD
jgi:hypothetical protein